MGIKNLKELIKQCHGNGIISNVHLNKYRGSIIAIDISNFMYRYKYRAQKVNNNPRYYLKYMYDLVSCLRKYDIIPVGVFDNKIPVIKVNEIKRRENTKKDKTVKIKNIIDDIKSNNPNLITTDTIATQVKEIKELTLDVSKIDTSVDKTVWKKISEIKKLSNQVIKVSEYDYNCCRGLFRYMGVPYITSEYEADDMCGYLYKSKLIDGCLSEDTDMLAHGVGLIFRNLNTYTHTITEYKLDNICNTLNLTYPEFVDTCILMGTDYYKIYRLGPKNAFRLINKYGTIDHPELLDELEKQYNIDSTIFNYKKIRDIFNQYMNDEQYSLRVEYMKKKLQLNSKDKLSLSPKVRLNKLINLMNVTCDISLDPYEIYECLNIPIDTEAINELLEKNHLQHSSSLQIPEKEEILDNIPVDNV